MAKEDVSCSNGSCFDEACIVQSLQQHRQSGYDITDCELPTKVNNSNTQKRRVSHCQLCFSSTTFKNGNTIITTLLPSSPTVNTSLPTCAAKNTFNTLYHHLPSSSSTLIKELSATNFESAPTRSQTLVHDPNFADIGRQVCPKDIISNKNQDLSPLKSRQLRIYSVQHPSSCLQSQYSDNEKLYVNTRENTTPKLILDKPYYDSNEKISMLKNLNSLSSSSISSATDTVDHKEYTKPPSLYKQNISRKATHDCQKHSKQLPPTSPSAVPQVSSHHPPTHSAHHMSSSPQMINEKSELAMPLVSRVWLTALVLLSGALLPGT